MPKLLLIHSEELETAAKNALKKIAVALGYDNQLQYLNTNNIDAQSLKSQLYKMDPFAVFIIDEDAKVAFQAAFSSLNIVFTKDNYFSYLSGYGICCLPNFLNQYNKEDSKRELWAQLQALKFPKKFGS